MDQLMAGSWSLLPLGWRVITKINQVIREEMNAIDSQEMLMPLLHPRAIWGNRQVGQCQRVAVRSKRSNVPI